MVEDEAIDVNEIPAAFKQEGNQPTDLIDTPFLDFDNLKEAKLAFEKEFINRKLVQNHNNITKTAEAIGVGRSFLHKKLKSYKI
jgi:two-component system nitrogen regulation response regulator NtrX